MHRFECAVHAGKLAFYAALFKHALVVFPYVFRHQGHGGAPRARIRRFFHAQPPAVCIHILRDFSVAVGDKIAQIAQEHIQKSVLVYGVIVEPLHRVEFIRNDVFALPPRNELSVPRKMLRRFARNALDLFDRHDLAVGTDELPLFADRPADIFQPLLGSLKPVVFNFAFRFDDLERVVPAGARQGAAASFTVAVMLRILPVIAERAIQKVFRVHAIPPAERQRRVIPRTRQAVCGIRGTTPRPAPFPLRAGAPSQPNTARAECTPPPHRRTPPPVPRPTRGGRKNTSPF